MTHTAQCTGCPDCSTELRSLLSATPEQYGRWLSAQDAKLRAAGARREMKDDYTPPDSYGPALRAATATNEPTFEARWKAERLRAFAAEAAEVAAEVAAVPRLTAAEDAELASYAPPNGYAAALKEGR